MTVQELMERLAKLDPAREVRILDGENAGGQPRTINLGPTTRVVSRQDGMETADCEDVVGVTVVVLGFGCY